MHTSLLPYLYLHNYVYNYSKVEKGSIAKKGQDSMLKGTRSRFAHALYQFDSTCERTAYLNVVFVF